MEDGTDSTDGSSIKPVSSLRSHFESMAGMNKATKQPPQQAEPSLHTGRENLTADSARSVIRGSLDLPRRESPWNSRQDAGKSPGRWPAGERIPRPSTPDTNSRQRPMSMGPFSPARSLPAVTVDAPQSPEWSVKSDMSHPSLPRASRNEPVTPASGDRNAPESRSSHYRVPSRPNTPREDLLKSPHALGLQPAKDALNSARLSDGGHVPSKSLSVPPPVNRAEKPSLANTRSLFPEKSAKVASTPHAAGVSIDDRVSPFSTPPSSDDSTTADDLTAHRRSQSRGNSEQSNHSTKSYPNPSQVHYSMNDKGRITQGHISLGSPHHPESRPRPHTFGKSLPSDDPERRPDLPPRREEANKGLHVKRISHSQLQSDSKQPLSSSTSGAGLAAGSSAHFVPPPRRNKLPDPSFHSARGEGVKGHASNRSVSGITVSGTRSGPKQLRGEEDSEEADTDTEVVSAPLTDYPDSSQANRRMPFVRKGQREIAMKYDARLFAICSEYVCTTGHFTRVWNTVTGELLMSLSHGDTVRITSLAFKATTNPDKDGCRLWLGTNYGEVHEVDILEKNIIFTKSNAHARREVIKIYRHEREMWSLDDEGKLHVWPPDESGSPNLKNTPHAYRVPKGHTFSLVVGHQLWLACGRELRVFQPSSAQNINFQPLGRSLSQPNVGEVTSGTTISKQPDRVYIGHNDGKVTIYSRSGYTCLGIINVSLYKINSLSGVGDYLWAGYNTGMIYVYDTKSLPWKVKKDWHAHEDPVISIMIDKNSIWKIDRLQVASFGVDNVIRLWDGTLQDDWLDSEMQGHDVEYCDFREVKAVVVTWNAGAAKPSDLRHDEEDANFFRDVLCVQDPPDVIVFGFQELVDLEDKKLTAKSFFKGSKKKDASDHEHMSRQYRAWRDYLTRSIEDHMASDQPYHLLHTASMVGLFTCIFVKGSERSNVRNLNVSEVKRGMGGLHGNKGALITRFIFDDSSLCFVNCHLAAGQTQTVSRNNDVTAILECPSLPGERNLSARTDTFVGGGDGTMILDHEICILNGDLNYRIDTMGRDTVVNTVKQNNLPKLLERDQLLLSRKRNPAFRLRAFNELPITFAPTYKYDVGTDMYDTSEKRRAPAWCDRILFRGTGRIKQINYRRHELKLSDHRPVSGTFKIRIKSISPKKRVMIWERCEQRFEEVKRKLADEAKLDFLLNVCRFSQEAAARVLATDDG